MRENVPVSFHQPYRKIQARMRVANERPVFDAFPLLETPFSFAHFAQYARLDADTGAYILHQYGLRASNSAIYTAAFPLNADTNPVPRNFSPVSYAFPSGTPLSEHHRALAACDGMVFAALNGIIYARGASAWTQLASLVDLATGTVPQITLYAIHPQLLVAAVVYASAEVQDRCKLVVIENGVPDTWKGYLPKHTARPGLAAFQDDDGTVHIYIDDWSGKKPLHIRRFAAQVWSATQQILPTDALDEDSTFRVGFASRFANGRIFLTGTLKRKYGPAYAVYMLGPETFTFGRDLVIASDFEKPLLLVACGQVVWAVGQENMFCSPLTPGIFSALAPENAADILNFSLDMQTNGADRLSMEIPISEQIANPEDLVAGAMLDLEVSANDQPYPLGRFGVDRFRHEHREGGESFLVDCSSYAMKKLMDWESDTFFDYMGQGVSYGNPGDLTRLVRFSGGGYTTPAGGGLQMEGLNVDGMLYTTLPSSHGGFLRCVFTNGNANTHMMGVGLNYGEETLTEAAARLGKPIEEVQGGERGRWALLAIYNPNPKGKNSTTGTIYLVDYNTLRVGGEYGQGVPNPYRIIAAADVQRPDGPATIILAMQYQDGFARVYYKWGTELHALRLVIAREAALRWDLHPTEHENYGRGLIFLRNNTGCHMSYPVMSDSDVIPLYGPTDKFKQYGVPLEDRPDRFPTAGFLQIDSERIYYTSRAGLDLQGNPQKVVTTDLQWVPGKVVARSGDGSSTPVGGSDLYFASTRGNRNPHTAHGNNYLMQSITPAVGTRLIAVRVWLTKVSFPEDGVTLSIHAGKVTGGPNDMHSVALLQKTLAFGSVSSSEMKPTGGWVTFYLSQDVVIEQSVYNEGKQYWIVLKRAKNPTHPSSGSYFGAYRYPASSYAGGGTFLFCEEDDRSLDQNGDIAFVAYGRLDDANKEYLFPVVYQAGVGLPANLPGEYWSGTAPTSHQYYWQGCALTITRGAGVNNCFRIVRSFRVTDSLNDLFVFAIDRDPGKIFGSDSMARAVPAFFGLIRGYGGTLAAAHGGNSLVHVPPGAFFQASHYEYFTADEDLTLAEVAEQIARKAGVVAVDLANRHPGEVAGRQAMPALNEIYRVPAQSKNCIVRLDLPYLGGTFDSAAVRFYDDQDQPAMEVVLTVGLDHEQKRWGYVQFNSRTSYWEPLPPRWVSYPTWKLSLPFDENIQGSFRVVLYDGHLSAWIGGRVLGGVHMGADLKEWRSVGCTLIQDTPSPTPMRVLIPQAGTRVDNFVMDMGKTGSQLLQSLVGEKRIYYRDDGSGRLKIFTDRQATGICYQRAVSLAAETTDIGLATRVLLEGGEVVEVSSAGNLKAYGNFFKTFNFREINNLEDAKYFADLVLEDMSLNRERIEVEGAVDPRIEPTDVIALRLPENVQRTVVVDGLQHRMVVDEQEASYEMRLSGRYSGPAECAE